jgi:hypothetical protein
MIQRGRESEEARKVAELAPPIPRPEPPDNLTPAQAVIWRRIVDCEAAGWFKPSQFGMLTNYCRLEVWGDELAISADSKAKGEFIRVSHEMIAIARSLRLTHQSRYYPEAAGRKAAAGGARPWERALPAVG